MLGISSIILARKNKIGLVFERSVFGAVIGSIAAVVMFILALLDSIGP